MILSSKSLLSLCLLTATISCALIYIPGIPVNPLTLYQLQVASNILQTDLNTNFGKPTQNNYKTYANTYLVNYFLQQLSNDPGIASYSNIIAGNGDAVTGSKNIIFGNSNSVKGSGNYVFSQNFNSASVTNGNMNNDLVLDNWLIELFQMYMIPFQAQYAIEKLA